ncbi:methionine synthase [Peptococcaceae bacterium CEB3]|nr:methionine synthase [Peptococcaceae bacterium CEB3]
MSTALESYARILIRYDLVGAAEVREIKATAKDSTLQEIMQCVIDGDSDAIGSLVKNALKTMDPMKVINEALIKGMGEVSRLWAEGTYYLPQVMVASDAMLEGIDLCEARLGKKMEKKGVVVTHTAEGDIHDLGQKIVNALLRANGYEVVDLGKDVPVDDVVAAVKKYEPLMVTGTALMTTTMTAFEKISNRLSAANINIPFVCGGGAVSNEYVTSYKYGVFGKDAQQAPQMVTDISDGASWQDLRERYNN